MQVSSFKLVDRVKKQPGWMTQLMVDNVAKHWRTNQPGTRTKFSVVVFSHQPNLTGTDQAPENKPTRYQNQVLCCGILPSTKPHRH